MFTFERSTKRKKEEKHINSIETENNIYQSIVSDNFFGVSLDGDQTFGKENFLKQNKVGMKFSN